MSLKGIIRSRGQYVAIVQAPDGKTYIVHVGDRVIDGTVKTITAQALVMVQEVNDPLSLTKQREIRKTLRGTSEDK